MTKLDVLDPSISEELRSKVKGIIDLGQQLRGDRGGSVTIDAWDLQVLLNFALFEGRAQGIYCLPNPYDGADRLPDLIRFYERHGFKKMEDGQRLVWDP